MTKRPTIFLVVILPVLVLGGVGIVSVMIDAFARLRDIPESDVPILNGMLISLPAVFLWIPIALLLANCILYAIAPLRRIAEQYAVVSDRPGFVESQRRLLIATALVGIVCIPLMILGYCL